MADFASEWNRVRRLGEQVHGTELNIQRVRTQIPSAEAAVTSAEIALSSAQSRLNSIPTYYGDDYEMRSMYEQMRAEAQMAVSKASYRLSDARNHLSNLRSEERSLNAQLLIHRAEASQTASEYREAGNQVRAKIAPANTAASKFQQMSGLRFGKNAAMAGSELSNQRALHYQSQASAYEELMEAANMAEQGIVPHKNSSSIAARGTFNPVSSPTTTAPETIVANSAGILGVTAINTAALAALASNSSTFTRPSSNSTGRFSAVSVPCSTGENSIALHSMINKLKMNDDDFHSFISENGLCLAAYEKSNTAELITISAAKVSSLKTTILAKPAPIQSNKSGEKKKIDGHTYYYDANNKTYRVDDTLVENSSYELNGYRFRTDEVGRVASVEGKLHFLEGKPKNISDTKEKIGKGYEQPFDDRGHLVAKRFNGPNGLENVIMQESHLNRSDYKKLENELAGYVEDCDVRIRITPVYEEDSFRPTKIIYTYWIDGPPPRIKIFKNSIKKENYNE